jgi:CBS domain-containing protein
MKVKEAMHKGVEWVDPSTPLRKLAQLMSEHDIGSIPIGENDRLIGIVTDRDIVIRGLANGRDLAKLTARDVMTKGVIFCRDDEEIDDATRTMELKQVRRLPVINKEKRMVGILALGDISNACEQEQSGEVLQAVSAHHN